MKKFKKNKAAKERIMDGAPTLIGANCSIEGSYSGNDSICIEGEFKGRVECEENVYVNNGAKVYADIIARFVAVHGEVKGNITAKEELNIGATGRITGDVFTPSLTVITGGFINGRCKMLSGEKDLQASQSFSSRVVDKFSLFRAVEDQESSAEAVETFEETLGSPEPAEHGVESSYDSLDDLVEINEDEEEKAEEKEPVS
jgi:cytoskeletal protein CcmA (bactofilin family)